MRCGWAPRSCRTGPHTALTIAERYGLCKRSSYDSPDIAHPRWIEAPSVRCYCTGESKSDTVYPRPGPLGAGTPRQRARRLIRLGAALLAPLPRARRRPDRSALRAGASAPSPAGYGRAGTRTATRAENTTSPSRALCSARARRAVSPPFTSPPSGACAGRLARARREGRRLGRPPRHVTSRDLAQVAGLSVQAAARVLRVSSSVLQRARHDAAGEARG